jgi:hypothetical protein
MQGGTAKRKSAAMFWLEPARRHWGASRSLAGGAFEPMPMHGLTA